MCYLVDSLPLLIQFRVETNCCQDSDCDNNELCESGWCVCRLGTVRTSVTTQPTCKESVSKYVLRLFAVTSVVVFYYCIE